MFSIPHIWEEDEDKTEFITIITRNVVFKVTSIVLEAELIKGEGSKFLWGYPQTKSFNNGDPFMFLNWEIFLNLTVRFSKFPPLITKSVTWKDRRVGVLNYAYETLKA